MIKIKSYKLSNISHSTGLFFVITFAIVCRIMIVSSQSYPLNDGGLFLTIIDTVKNHSFLYPDFINYNQMQIPFAYPPLAFYLVATLSKLMSLETLLLVRFLPTAVSFVTLGAFYAFSRTLLKSGWAAVFATYAFAMIPRGFSYIIMGGGVTRSFGQLLSILTLFAFLRRSSEQPKVSYFLFLTPLALLLITHPEWSIFTIVSLLVLTIFSKTRLTNLILVLKTSFFALLLASPWLVITLLRHGLSPFQAAMSVGGWSFPFVTLITLRFTGESYLPFFFVLGFISCLWSLARGKYFLPIWIIAAILTLPRAAGNSAVVPLALAIGQLFGHFFTVYENNKIKYSFFGAILAVSWFYLFQGYSFTSILASQPQDAYFASVSPDSVSSMKWISQNSDNNSSFLVLSPETYDLWSTDKTAEWFPVIAGRKSQTTVQGLEWLPGEFVKKTRQLWVLNYCMYQDISCVTEWVKFTNTLHTHLFINSPPGKFENTSLLYSLKSSPEYRLVYEKATVSVWKKLNSSDTPNQLDR